MVHAGGVRVVLGLVGGLALMLGAVSPVTADVNCDHLPVSIGTVPPEVTAVCGGRAKASAVAQKSTSDLAYGVGADAVLYSLVLGSPEVLTSKASVVPAPVFINGVEFDNSGTFSVLYALDSGGTFFTLDTSDGTYAAVGAAAPYGGETFTGLATDPTTGTMYACSTSIAASSLYTIDPSTGTATRIGEITNEPAMIGIAVDTSGQMWGYGLINDSLLQIDKATGAGTIIGFLGFDTNYGQGMDFDESDGTLYLFAYNNSSFQAELRTCDTSTGSTALVGPLGSTTPGNMQMGSGAVGTGGMQVGAALAATKEVSGQLFPGATVTYAVEISNSGPDGQPDDPASDEFDDTLPSQLTLTGATVVSGGGAVVVAGNTVRWNGTIASGGSVTLEITATVNPSVPAGTVVSNQGTIRWDSDADGDNDGSGVTDDPDLPGTDDATAFDVAEGAATAIPDLGGAGLAIMVLLLAMVAVLKLRLG